MKQILAVIHFIIFTQHQQSSSLFPYTTLFRSQIIVYRENRFSGMSRISRFRGATTDDQGEYEESGKRSEEHTSELQSPYELVCRLLLENKQEARADAVRELSQNGQRGPLHGAD